MKVTLARWNDWSHSSSGRWLIRQVPGLVVFSTGVVFNSEQGLPAWKLHALKSQELDLLAGLQLSAVKTWGEKPDLGVAAALLKRHPELQATSFSSLGEARVAVGLALAGKTESSALGDLIT